jgi:hypothetical protein
MAVNPIGGQWHFNVISDNSLNGMDFAVGIAEKPQSPVITNADEISALASGNNIVVRGIAPVLGQVHLLLADAEYEEIYRASVDTEAGGNFEFLLPSVPTGRYTLIAQAENVDGFLSDVNVANIVIDATAPIVNVDEKFERLIYGDTVDFAGYITSGGNPEIAVNGQNIPRQDIELIAGSIPEPGKPATLMFYATLPLQHGMNEVVVTATGSGGIITQRTVMINSDQTTPEPQKSTPRITDVSINDHEHIKGMTTVTFTVENGNIDDTIVSAFDSFGALDVMNISGNNFSFVIDTNHYTPQYESQNFSIRAENKWGHRDWASRFVFFESSDDSVVPILELNTNYIFLDWIDGPQEFLLEWQLNPSDIIIGSPIFTSACNFVDVTEDGWVYIIDPGLMTVIPQGSGFVTITIPTVNGNISKSVPVSVGEGPLWRRLP